jgi:biotin-dependent carboxylase-like uncharacterized protein
MTLTVARAGPLCTLQDAGRQGFLRFGITPAGPMDWTAHRLAQRMLGNADGAAAVEIGPGGLDLRASGRQRLAICAPGFRVVLDGQPLPSRVALTLEDGSALQILPGPAGTWGYLALPGGVDGPVVMGSRSSHLRSGLGRGPFQPGDRLEALAAGADAPDTGLYPPVRRDDGPLRFVPGPQDDLFAPDVQALLARATFHLSPRSDRMAYRLSGPALPAMAGHDIVSDGITMGAIQVPGDGQPFVLMADRQPTGGYPKIGTVIRADLPRLAQARAGQVLRFAPVTVADAVAAVRQAHADLDHQMTTARTIRAFRWG